MQETLAWALPGLLPPLCPTSSPLPTSVATSRHYRAPACLQAWVGAQLPRQEAAKGPSRARLTPPQQATEGTAGLVCRCILWSPHMKHKGRRHSSLLVEACLPSLACRGVCQGVTRQPRPRCTPAACREGALPARTHHHPAGTSAGLAELQPGSWQEASGRFILVFFPSFTSSKSTLLAEQICICSEALQPRPLTRAVQPENVQEEESTARSEI